VHGLTRKKVSSTEARVPLQCSKAQTAGICLARRGRSSSDCNRAMAHNLVCIGGSLRWVEERLVNLH